MSGENPEGLYLPRLGPAALLADAMLLIDRENRVAEACGPDSPLRPLAGFAGTAGLRELLAESDRDNVLAAAARARETGEAVCEGAVVLRSGEVRWTGIRFVQAGGEAGALLMALSDRSGEREKDREIERLRQRDALTGFYNRTSLTGLLAGMDRGASLPLRVVSIDINGMKLTNDAFGYAEGDRLILRAAAVLKTICPVRGAVVRLGGDEFLMLIPRCDEAEGSYFLETIERLCEEEDDAMVPPNLSMGMAAKTHERQDIFSIIREADEQLNSRRGEHSRRHRNRLIRRLMDYLADRNFETGKHIVRVKGLALMLGDALGLSEKQLDNLSLAADMHDIGKVAIPERILGKRGPLTPGEWEIVRKHPETGYRVAYALPELIGVSSVVLHHHEWWNGQGYPYGLAGEDIPLLARIISVADAYDNMINGPYRQRKLTRAQALAEIERCAGVQFDPGIAARFIGIMGREG